VGEIWLAVQALRAAYDGIQYCVEALSEGTVQVQKIKKAVDNAQTIVKDVRSIWSTIKGLFGVKPAAAPAPTPEAAPVKPKKDEYITHVPTEAEVVQQFLGHIGQFFKLHKTIVHQSEDLLNAEYAKDNPDPDVILQLSAYKHETDQAYMKLSGMMRGAHVPPQLGPLWDNFNAIYGQVQEEQRARKERERIKRNNDAWLRRQTRDFLIDRALAVVWTLAVLAWMWGLLLCFKWQGMTQRGFA
jgi:hypothetical protein